MPPLLQSNSNSLRADFPRFLPKLFSIELFPRRHKVVHNGGSPHFYRLFLNKNTTDMAQSLSYKGCSIILPKFTTFGLFILILSTSAVMDQIACCYVVTTSENRSIATGGATRALIFSQGRELQSIGSKEI